MFFCHIKTKTQTKPKAHQNPPKNSHFIDSGLQTKTGILSKGTAHKFNSKDYIIIQENKDFHCQTQLHQLEKI